MKYLLIPISLFLLSSCVTDGNKAKTATTNPIQKREATSELAEKLYNGYMQNPATQAQKDENALIDYAIDHQLDVTKTTSGLYYLIKKQGTGPMLVNNQPCSAHYDGYTLDGKIFDSSHKRGVPLTFNVGAMIPGWNEALKFMNVGTKAQLLIPSHLAYGKRGFPGLIEPNTPLIFDIEIMPLTN